MSAAAFDGGGGEELGLELHGEEAHLLGDACGLARVLLFVSFPLLRDCECGLWWWCREGCGGGLHGDGGAAPDGGGGKAYKTLHCISNI
ncbi:hypothetical protein QJS04_geneDACA011540 [Acorus gramineus]|uniref:Uncharacterized protein n=1 Tax=Acorus gramineus TaxID=55184 RepID=A0AAV9AEY4_ACOGR|nr:hypothetical protein QJS04_geneDACA011540 [Acorus gramineus]